MAEIPRLLNSQLSACANFSGQLCTHCPHHVFKRFFLSAPGALEACFATTMEKQVKRAAFETYIKVGVCAIVSGQLCPYCPGPARVQIRCAFLSSLAALLASFPLTLENGQKRRGF